jgi:Fic family protein
VPESVERDFRLSFPVHKQSRQLARALKTFLYRFDHPFSSAAMNDRMRMMENLRHSNVDPVCAAAAVSFGFVFIHPFEDGNGRIHRYLI